MNYSIFIGVEDEEYHMGTYICVKGYHLVGQKDLSCQASNEWDAPTPTCHGKGPSFSPVHFLTPHLLGTNLLLSVRDPFSPSVAQVKSSLLEGAALIGVYLSNLVESN